jgi:hypothetical protein
MAAKSSTRLKADTPLLEVEETAMDPKYDRRELQRTVDLKAKLLAVSIKLRDTAS